jgi:FAD:protein FMN transferase
VSVATLSLPALGTTATLSVTNPGRLASARSILETELARLDEACSRFRPDSELTLVNAAAGRPVVVSARLLEAIRVALQAAACSDGTVDPTVGRTLRLSGYDRTFRIVRQRDGTAFRARFASVPGWRQVEIDPERRTVRIPAGCELDVGATAKASAADRIAERAAALCGGVLVSLGGDIAVAGTPPANGWPIRLADDHASRLDGPGPAIAIRAGGLATSSTMVRRWRAGRGELHHVVDPRSGRPADSPWRTVTVAAGSCLDANVASTASIVLGEAAPEWLARSNLPARLVDATGSVVFVAGWPEESG